MTGDDLQMLLFIALIFFGTLSICPIYSILNLLNRRRQKKHRKEVN